MCFGGQMHNAIGLFGRHEIKYGDTVTNIGFNQFEVGIIPQAAQGFATGGIGHFINADNTREIFAANVTANS